LVNRITADGCEKIQLVALHPELDRLFSQHRNERLFFERT
jgi:hypothetical protein